ncbi:MAG: S8 family serine peptidase, partial [Paraclostridium sp.]
SWNLVEALEKILYTDINIINISASTTNCPCEKELEEICKKLYKEGKVIVCSHHNDKNYKFSIPTKFKTVLGVNGSNEVFEDMDYIYNPHNEVQIYGNSKDKFLNFKGDITHFGRNSRAAAVFSGIVANLIKENGYKTDKIENLIMKNSIDSKCLYNVKKKKSIHYDEEKTQIAKRLVTLINDKFGVKKIDLDFLKQYSLLNTFTDIGRHNAYEFLLKINEEFGVNIDYRKVFIYDLDYLNNIVQIIQENLKKKK